MPSTARITRPNVDTPQYLSLYEAEAAGYGAYSTLRSWIAAGRLPAVRTGRRIKIRLEDLEAFARPAVVHHSEAKPAPETELNFAIARIVANAPRLTQRQREQLATIIGGGEVAHA